MNQTKLLAGVAAGALLSCAAPAFAQTIDYGALEQVFGEPVTTSATGSPLRSTEAPVDITIITAEEIKRSGATDLPTIISRVAGVDLLSWSATGADISVRGYNQPYSPRLLVLVNGRQVYLDHYGYTAWSTLPVQLEEIRQIEVVRGPNSALFGFNAVAGVVNIITYHPRLDDTDVAALRVGTQDHMSGSLVGSFDLGEVVSVRLSGGAQRQDERDPRGNLRALSARDEVDKVNAAIDLAARLTEQTELRVEGSWSNVQESGFSGVYAYDPTKYIVTSVKAALTSDTPIGLVQAQIYTNGLTVKTGIGDFDNRITSASVQDLFKLGADHTIRLGLEYRQNELHTPPVAGGLVGYQVWAPSAMWNWTATPKLSTTLAVRLDNLQLERKGTFPRGVPLADNRFWDREDRQVSVNAGLVYKATELDTVRAAYARGVQSPTLLELGGLQIVFPVSPFLSIAIMGDPALEPSIVSNYQLSYDRLFPAWNARASAKLFYQTTEDVKGFYSLDAGSSFNIPATRTTFPAITYVNTGESEMRGVELAASGGGTIGLRWSLDWTYTDISDDVDPRRDAIGRQVLFGATSPEHRANAALGWADERWAIDGYLRYVSDFSLYTGAAAGPRLAQIEAYATLGGRVGYSFGEDLVVAVSGENLLEDRQHQTVGMDAERRLILSVSKGW